MNYYDDDTTDETEADALTSRTDSQFMTVLDDDGDVLVNLRLADLER